MNSRADGILGVPRYGAYCASKFAVRGLVQSAAMDWAKYGITVNGYAPGPIDTPLSAYLLCAH